MSVSMAQSSLVLAREMPRWMLGAAPFRPLLSCGPVLGINSLG